MLIILKFSKYNLKLNKSYRDNNVLINFDMNEALSVLKKNGPLLEHLRNPDMNELK